MSPADDPKGTPIAILGDALLWAAVIALYAFPFIGLRDLYYQDEVRYGGIVADMIARDAWATMAIAGEPYLDKGPIYFALFRAAVDASGSNAPAVFVAVNAGTLLFYIAATYGALRLMDVSHARARLAAWILLSLPYTAAYANILRMDFLFAGIILLAFAVYLRGLDDDEPNSTTVEAGALVGLAVMVKGPFGLLFPVGGAALAMVFQGNAQRILKRDVWMSLGLAGLIVFGWFGFLVLEFGPTALRNIAEVQLVERAMQSVDGRKPWWTYLTGLPLVLLPWLAIALLALSRGIRREELDWPCVTGLAFVIVALAIMQIVAQKSVKYLFPVLPFFALFLAIAIERADRDFSGILRWGFAAIGGGMALFFFVLAGAAVAEAEWLGDLREVGSERLFWFGLASAVGAAIVAASGWRTGWQRTLPVILSLIVIFSAAKGALLPDVNRLFSPRVLSAEIATVTEDGETVTIFGVYRGTFSYHLSAPHRYVYDPGAAALAEGPLVLPEDLAQRFPEVVEGRVRAAEGRIEDQQIVVYTHR
ncbi:MAG: hypothetical protein AAFR35_03170 [Pseudomonadota bacterium]